MPLYPNLVQVAVYPPPFPEMKSWQIWNFQVKWNFKFQSATLSPPSPTPPSPRNEKLADLELSSQVGLKISKCHFIPPPPFANPQMADLKLLSQVGPQISKCHFIPSPSTPLKMRHDLWFLIFTGTIHRLEETWKCITCHLVFHAILCFYKTGITEGCTRLTFFRTSRKA